MACWSTGRVKPSWGEASEEVPSQPPSPVGAGKHRDGTLWGGDRNLLRPEPAPLRSAPGNEATRGSEWLPDIS